MSIDQRFEELYEREYELVFRATYLMCADRKLAEDSTQEAFARCLERWGRLKDQPWVAGWVARTALNHARRSLRRRAEPSPIQSSDHDAETTMDIWLGIRSLPRRQQEAVVLHYAIDLPLVVVARLMGCSEGTVKSHLSRARDALRRRLEEVPG